MTCGESIRGERDGSEESTLAKADRFSHAASSTLGAPANQVGIDCRNNFDFASTCQVENDFVGS